MQTRPLVLVEAKTSDGELHSAILQNAETVRLIGPDGESPLSQGWSTISVSELAAGHKVYIHRQVRLPVPMAMQTRHAPMTTGCRGKCGCPLRANGAA